MRKLKLIGLVVGVVVAATGCNLVVTPAAPNGWFFLNEGANGSGQFVNGPGNPPAGRGSALLTVDGTGRESIATGSYSGQALAGLTQLKYSTYQAYSGSPNETPALEFDVDYDSTDSSTAYQGRLVYVPSAASAVVPGQWQSWDTMSGGGRVVLLGQRELRVPPDRRRCHAGRVLPAPRPPTAPGRRS